MDSAEPAGGDLSADRPAASSLRCGEEEPDKEGDAGGKSGGSSREENLNPELQQGYRILQEFLLEKYRPLTAPFLKPLVDQASIREECCLSGRSSSHSFQQSPAGMGLLKMEEKFSSGQYTGIADFVGDFRLMLETCYRLHGVDHWRSKQAQKLEMMLEQKLALLSRHLREKTSIAVTSRGCYGLEDEKGTACISTRRRSTPRNLVGLSTGMFESVMVQVLRQEEQLRAKEEKRVREQERKEAEEASQKEIEEWEKSLLAQAAPTRMETMWEIPAIGHFLCLAQQILNLPEIVFYELERCLLMPQCNAFLSKIMTSLLSPPHRRSTLHRRPTLSYRTWEAALRQKVQHWYTVVGQTDNPNSSAEKLGLCPQFFKVLGEVNPLEEKPFHELPFYQKVWLLKGLCDFVYETQKDVQDAVLGQPIHECREVILGYDYLENAYVHFPQFCGADVRIYKQKPFQAPEFPSPPIKVKKVSRIKLEKVKHGYVSKSNGEVSSDGREELLHHSKTEVEKSTDSTVTCPEKNTHLGSFRVTTEEINCEIKTTRICDIKKTGCYKENLRNLTSSGEIVGMGGHPSSGETRAVENGQCCTEMARVKVEISPFKGSTLKACQMHVNGTHDSQDINYHESAKETVLENSLRNVKKLNKLRAKKKKKKKKKLKDILNENLQRKLDDLQRKREIHLHPFKSYKSEIQSKLFIIKKKAKHKKHKSGKKSVSKKAITRKRKGVTKSTIPEFQGRWYHRKQAVKELHGTLIRLLNELLPWEPKLMKAFQRNRSRLKKDYDDFQRHPDHDKYAGELWSNDESEVDSGKDSFPVVCKSSEFAEHVEVHKKDHPDNDEMKLLEMNLPAGKNRILKKESTSKEIQKTLPKCVKRQSKQNCCLDQSTNELSPRKKAKLSTNEAVVHSSESTLQPDSCLTVLKQFEGSTLESFTLTAPPTSVSNFLKGTKPIQALLAKNTGNKVTLTNQLPPPPGITVSTEKPVLSLLESSLIKPALPCQTSSKTPLQMVYKMPNGQCVPIDLHNSSVKIQIQPVIDPKTGEKVMQQVVILPKNFLIQQKEGKIASKDIQSLQQKSSELHCTTLPEISNVSVSLTPVLVTCPTNTTTQSPSTVFNKNITPLSQVVGPLNTTQPLPAVTSASNLSTFQVSQTETDRIKTTISTATLPVSLTLPTLSTASQSLISATAFSGSTNTASACHSLASQQTTDSFETRQELKTVCVRESQSILVTTRGGNTGIVKVQTNPDQISPSSLSSSSVFTYAPQLQAFLVPKTTALSCSTLPSVATATSGFPHIGQLSLSGFAPSTAASVNIPRFPTDFTQAMEKNTKFTLQQPAVGGILSQVIENSCCVSSPPLSSSSLASNLMSGTPNSPASVTCIGQNNTVITPNSSMQQQGDIKTKTNPVIRSESNLATNGDLISGTPVQKLTLVTNPPILSPCGTPGVSIIPSPSSTGVNAQKLVFINTQIANGPSTSNLVAESLKHNLPSSLSKTFVSATEQPQLVLIPSTVGAPVRINSSPTVAQVKDVKIGLNIGQTIVNTKDNAQQAPPVNISLPAISKGEDKKSMGLALSLTGGSTLVPVPCFVSQSAMSVNDSVCLATKVENAFTVTTAESVSVTTSGTTSGTQPTVLISGNDPSRVRPVLGNRLWTSNIGNTVGISTVKTGHLASSVLISTTQPTVSPQNLASALQFPVISFSGPSTTPQKVLHTVPQLSAVPAPPPVPKSQLPALLQFQSSGVSAAMPSNADIHRPQSVLPLPSPSTGKVISFPSSSSLRGQQVLPGTEKQSHAYTCASTIQTFAASPALTSKAGGQLNESCMQQKIVINTCMPLAPGTQIMINGTCFVVPPQGLGAGSHVLLLSCNTKQTPPSIINHDQEAQGVPTLNPITSKIMIAPSNSLNWQLSKHPLKSPTKIVNSFGSADALPIIHATQQIFSAPASSCTPLSAATLSVSSVIKSPVNVVTTSSVVSAVHLLNSHLPSNTSVFHLDTSVKKLLVSPEGAILNAINTPASKVSSLSSLLPPVVVSTSKNPTTVFPASQSSCLDKPDKAAS
ncbi:putative bromodomain-containing protein 10 isoform X2 [Athene noctua]|uniref:putative bromodomain-containing protein 10 isoform X2 n=1 Tax=Athene noctua TaxID=126797 RepID=UPI003EBC951F